MRPGKEPSTTVTQSGAGAPTGGKDDEAKASNQVKDIVRRTSKHRRGFPSDR